MAPSPFSRREAIPREVLISTGDVPRQCTVLIDSDCLIPDSRPGDLGGVLDLPRPECEALASADHLVLTLCETGELYRVILDGGSGRFVARRL